VPEDEYAEYERACATIRKENAKLMPDFEQRLSGQGLANKTIRRHMDNVDFYINTYLLNEDAVPASEGAGHVSMFLGYWFVRKAMWASPGAIRENAATGAGGLLPSGLRLIDREVRISLCARG
jgi:hypothetical protein